jgi:hypothetical protein
MLKEYEAARIVPHPIEWIAVAATQVTPLTGKLAYEKFAQFRYKQHAYEFAKSITCYHTMIVPPAMHGVTR